MDLPQVAEKSWKSPIAMTRKSRAPAATHKFGPSPVPPRTHPARRALPAGPSAGALPTIPAASARKHEGGTRIAVGHCMCDGGEGCRRLMLCWDINLLYGMTPTCLGLQYGQHLRRCLAADRGI